MDTLCVFLLHMLMKPFQNISVLLHLTTHRAQERHSCIEQDRWFRLIAKTPYHNSPRQSSCHVLCAYCVMTYNTALSKLLSWTRTVIYCIGFVCLLKQAQISPFRAIQYIQHAELYINDISVCCIFCNLTNQFSDLFLFKLNQNGAFWSLSGLVYLIDFGKG